MGLTLAEYAKRHPTRSGPRCSSCALPKELIRTVRKEHDKGVSYSTISRWLREYHGVSVSAYTLGYCHRNHVAK